MNQATEQFRAIAKVAIDDCLEQDPVGATWLGDHRFDSMLPDYSAEAIAAFTEKIDRHLTALDAVDDVELLTEDLVDLEILRAHLLKVQFDLTQVQEHTWNPMVWNPGTALHLLESRDFAPRDERRRNLESRAEEIPGFLEQARATLKDMSAIHVETAIVQLQGTLALVGSLNLDQRISDSVSEQIAWLTDELPLATRSPRLGPELYAGILWHALDDSTDVETLYATAHDHLGLVGDQMRKVAHEYLAHLKIESVGDPVREALDHIATTNVVTNENVLDHVRSAVASARAFTIEHNIVTVPEIDTEVIEMPEIHRGVAVAYCDAPGPLEVASVPTFVAVAPTPVDWTPERALSFYREYNAVQIHDLTIHEAIPGHVLQLAVGNSGTGQSDTRRFGFSGAFVEGWAVYSEEVMINAGYSPQSNPASSLAIRLQQLKMQTRMIINTILDIGVHTKDMSEHQAMDLMMQRGYQEEGEAAGKWRRALLTSGQLPTYFVGYLAVKGLADDLKVMHPDWSLQQIHDLLLSFGSPAPRYVRELVGL
jgi:uncharacterized protein (DUF885 family)